jgi:branched-chain amino acid transport system permease protein
MNAFVDILFSGLFQGSLYAIMAVGLGLVWTTSGVFNFSHGVMIMLGAYLCWTLSDPAGLGLPLYLSIPAVVIVAGVLGWILQWILVRPFIGTRDLVLTVVIMTLAAASFLENLSLEAWGPRAKQLPPLVEGTIGIGGFNVSLNQVTIIALTPLVLLGIWLIMHRTRLGLNLRAVSQNIDSSLLVGLKPNILFGVSFAVAAGMAALAGIFLASFKFMSPGMGTEPLTKALIVVIFGGISTINGPILAAYIIGLIEATSTYFLGLYWTPSVLFLIMIATLMVRPEGLLAVQKRGLS